MCILPPAHHYQDLVQIHTNTDIANIGTNTDIISVSVQPYYVVSHGIVLLTLELHDPCSVLRATDHEHSDQFNSYLLPSHL